VFLNGELFPGCSIEAKAQPDVCTSANTQIPQRRFCLGSADAGDAIREGRGDRSM